MKKADQIIEILEKEYPNARIALNFGDNWQLLVAVALSAQCTDERVNKVTPALFERFPSVEDFASANLEEIEQLIYSTGFYRAKARNIKGAAERVVSVYGGKVPDTMEDLLTLPGVARKTANVILHTAFGKACGIVVDTHVIRISGLLKLVPAKLVKTKNAVAIEKKLVGIVPQEKWGSFTHLLINHGRKVCIARRPRCGECVLNKLCPSAKL